MPTTEELIGFIEDEVVGKATDPWVKSRFAGLIAVAATTEFELSVKATFISFCRTTNPLFGDFVQNKFKNLRGRIKVDGIKDEFLRHLGPEYSRCFQASLDVIVRNAKDRNDPDPVENYNILIENRHLFVHQGDLILSLENVCDYYRNGLLVMEALRDSLAQCKQSP